MKAGFQSVQLKQSEFDEFKSFLLDASGIDLGENKQYLVSTRIRHILSDYKCSTLTELMALLKQPSGRVLRQQIIDVMTTNETFWFRDGYPFDYLTNNFFPEQVKDARSPRLRVWCAACSSGQEPYSISMVAEEYLAKASSTQRFDLEIVATDLSSRVLEQAKSGIYDRLSISRGLSQERLNNFFDEGENQTWKARSSISRRINFRPLNLQESYSSLGKFDVIFCRNVLIYFSKEFKTDILTRIHGCLKPGGLLFLGASESLAGANELFDMINCRPGIMYKAR